MNAAPSPRFSRPALALAVALAAGLILGLALAWRSRIAAGSSRIDWPASSETSR